jgi:hypothetical protein
MNPSVDFECVGEETSRAALGALEAEGLQVVRSFDLIRPGSDACRCPRHGKPGCTCQYSVLLVYPPAGPPAAITVHAYDGRTQLEIVLDPNALPDTELVGRILGSLVEAGGSLAGTTPTAVSRRGVLPA